MTEAFEPTSGIQTIAGAVTLTQTAGTLIGNAALRRDGIATVQVTSTAPAPAAATVIATITPGVAAIWEITGFVFVTGTTVVATDTNNMALNQTAAAKLSPVPYIVPGVTGMTIVQALPVLLLNLSAVDTVNITAIANATALSSYTACLVARRAF